MGGFTAYGLSADAGGHSTGHAGCAGVMVSPPVAVNAACAYTLAPACSGRLMAMARRARWAEYLARRAARINCRNVIRAARFSCSGVYQTVITQSILVPAAPACACAQCDTQAIPPAPEN